MVESNAILRYIGREGNLMPNDNWSAAKVDEAIQLTDDMFNAFAPTFSIKDEAVKIAARTALVADGGGLAKVFAKFDALIKNLNGQFFGGDNLSVADISIFVNTKLMGSGFLDGFPTDYLDRYENLVAFNKKVGTHPKVVTRYANSDNKFHGIYKY